MDRETARQEIRQRISCEKYLTKSLRGNYICPFCGSGKGKHKTGALKVYDTNTFTCHACNKSGDVIDLYRNQTSTDYNTALNELASSLGIAIDNDRPTAPETPQKRPQSDEKGQGNINTPLNKKTLQRRTEGKTAGQRDFTEYYKACSERIEEPAAVEYLQSRCISVHTAKLFSIGYDPQADPAESGHHSPRIIIPTSKAHYIARSIDQKTPAAYSKMNPKGAKPAIFNEQALYTPGVQEVFVTEGAFDALSILETQMFNAIALNSAANVNLLLKRLTENETAATLIICLDNDERGEEAKQTLVNGLKKLNINFTVANISGDYKDANELLVKDAGAFIEALWAAKRKALKPNNTVDYIADLMQDDIKELAAQEIKTGFTDFDKQAGGLYSGLYVLAAISSLGKTSFALQLADQLAERGNNIFFISLEQSRLELVTKSIARQIALNDFDNIANRKKTITSLDIRKNKNNLTTKNPTVTNAINRYINKTQGRISIIEGNFNCDINYISAEIKRYMQQNGKSRPIVFIDYLQVLQPTKDQKKATTKEIIDRAVLELKRLSRELNLTIILISSVNRANYLAPIDFESFKESGGIEYTADVVLGLQFQCMNEELFTTPTNQKTIEKRNKIKQAKNRKPRQIELVCLKNRYGIANFECEYNYYPANDLFIEIIPDVIIPESKADNILIL